MSELIFIGVGVVVSGLFFALAAVGLPEAIWSGRVTVATYAVLVCALGFALATLGYAL